MRLEHKILVLLRKYYPPRPFYHVHTMAVAKVYYDFNMRLTARLLKSRILQMMIIHLLRRVYFRNLEVFADFSHTSIVYANHAES
jgi:hypothetical protein